MADDPPRIGPPPATPAPRVPSPGTPTPGTPAAQAPPAPPAPPPPVPAAEPTPDEPPKAARRAPNKALQNTVETAAVIIFLAVTVLPLARLGLVPLGFTAQVGILIGVSYLLIPLLILYERAGYRSKGPLEARVAARVRDDRIINALSIATTILFAVLIFVELGAFLVFAGVISSTGNVVVAVNQFFLLFAAFTLLFLDLLLIARTSFDSRYRPKPWHRDVAFYLLGVSGLVLLIGLLKALGLLNVGFFAAITEEQSVYVLSLATLFQFLAFRLVLRYPSLARVFRSEIDVARRANTELRTNLEKKALRAYMAGLAFILISFFLLGGVATGRVTTGDRGTSSVILFTYVTAAVVLLIVILARYVQHKFIAERARRKEQGELIARRRLTPQQVSAIFIYSFSGLFALLFVLVAVFTFRGATIFRPDVGTDFLIAAFLVGVGPFGFRRAMDMRRIKAMDDKFPDFLRDLAEGMRAGMTLPRALYASSRGTYGALTPEISKMSKQVEWGISFTEALSRFSQRVKTPLIERTVSLINEASKAGGSVVEILTAASNDAREIKQILDERGRQMGIYSVIIYVAFIVFLVVVFVLATQFLPSFQDAVRGASGAQVGGLAFAPFDERVYIMIFWHAALIQGIGGGLVAGVMSEGHAMGGLRHSFVMTVITWVFFRVLL